MSDSKVFPMAVFMVMTLCVTSIKPVHANAAEHIRQTANMIPPTRLTTFYHKPIKRLVVTDYYQFRDGNNFTPAIERAIHAAKAGDEIYFPNGHYQLTSTWSNDPHTSIKVTSNILITGESEQGVILQANIPLGDFQSPYQVIMAQGVHHTTLKNLTITSTWQGTYSADPSTTNPEAGGPDYGIAIGKDDHGNMSHNLTFRSITIEKFRKAGFKVGAGSHHIMLDRCLAKNATDVGAGGAGYGYLFQGKPRSTPSNRLNPNLHSAHDNYANTLIHSRALGPYIRHGVVLQYFTHHNRIIDNHFADTAYGAIDLHGEHEYANTISNNVISHVSKTAMHHYGTNGGGGIELGNSGGTTHAASGPDNWIHDNTILDSKYGVKIEYGTTNTLVEHNTITENHTISSGVGIYLGHTRHAEILNNTIHHNNAPDYSGIRFVKNRAMHRSRAGGPSFCILSHNMIKDNRAAWAIRIDSQNNTNQITDNVMVGNGHNGIKISK